MHSSGTDSRDAIRNNLKIHLAKDDPIEAVTLNAETDGRKWAGILFEFAVSETEFIEWSNNSVVVGSRWQHFHNGVIELVIHVVDVAAPKNVAGN